MTTTVSPLPSTTPRPDAKKTSTVFEVLSTLFLISTLLSVSLNFFLLNKMRPTRSGYEEVRNPDNPYQSTVQSIEEEEIA